MNIQKELKEFLSRDSNDNKSIIKQAEEYRKTLEKKTHILAVLNIAHVIDKLVDNKILEKAKVSYIKLRIGDVFDSYDQNKNFLWDAYDKKIAKINNSIKEVFKSELNEKYLGAHLSTFIDLEKPVKEQVFKILLSKELRTIVEYNQMQMDLSEKNHEITKKLKL